VNCITNIAGYGGGAYLNVGSVHISRCCAYHCIATTGQFISFGSSSTSDLISDISVVISSEPTILYSVSAVCLFEIGIVPIVNTANFTKCYVFGVGSIFLFLQAGMAKSDCSFITSVNGTGGTGIHAGSDLNFSICFSVFLSNNCDASLFWVNTSLSSISIDSCYFVKNTGALFPTGVGKPFSIRNCYFSGSPPQGDIFALNTNSFN
jgi:hypothetical protein